MIPPGQEGPVFINGDPNAQNGMMPPPFAFPGWPTANGQQLMLPPGMPPMPGMQMHMVQLDIPVPVDPALVGDAQNGEEGGAEEDGDADENGAEGDEGDEGTEDGSGTRPQLTHSTSNTRGSTSTEHKPKGRKGRKKAMNAPAGTEFRQILVPVPVPIGSAPPDPAQYQQQYAQYAQLYAQFYSQYLHQQHLS